MSCQSLTVATGLSWCLPRLSPIQRCWSIAAEIQQRLHIFFVVVFVATAVVVRLIRGSTGTTVAIAAFINSIA